MGDTAPARRLPEREIDAERPHRPASESTHGTVAPSGFRPAWWCRGPHLQTLWPYLFRRRPRPAYSRERVELADGDFLDIDWLGAHRGRVAIVLHGLQGSSDSHYVRTLSSALAHCDWRVAAMHFRGCSGDPNRMHRTYHSGETGDFAEVLERLRERHGGSRFVAVGFSLGGNVLLKWLGETGAATLDAAVAVSVPLELATAADRLERGFSRVYQRNLVTLMCRALALKYRHREAPIDISGLARLQTFRQFDDAVTAPLHGFRDSEDYYARASSRQFLGGVRTPTLVVHAADDPFMKPSVIPRPDELAPSVRVEVSSGGGHVGFVAARRRGTGHWLDDRIVRFLEHRS